MTLTRRTLLGQLGALSAASAVSPTALTAWAGGLPPNPNSTYVLFEGPWLLTAGKTAGTIGAMTLGASHVCQLGVWDAAHKMITNPSADPGIGPVTAAPGSDWRGSFPSLRTQNGASFDSLLRTAALTQRIFYVNSGTSAVTPVAGDDRTVVLPMPDVISVAGEMFSVTFDVNPTNLLNVNANPSIVTILEYKNQGPGFTLTIDDGTGTKFAVAQGQHFVLRLQRQQDDQDEKSHVMGAVNDLFSKIHYPAGGHKCIVTDISTLISNSNPLGLTHEELSIDPVRVTNLPPGPRPPPHPLRVPSREAKTAGNMSHAHPVNNHLGSTTFANCAGGGGFGGSPCC